MAALYPGTETQYFVCRLEFPSRHNQAVSKVAAPVRSFQVGANPVIQGGIPLAFNPI